jgi:hypothetical protein
MDLRTATPAQIDTAIADLEVKAWKQGGRIASALKSLHYAVGDRQAGRTGWNMTDDQVTHKAQNLLEDERPGFIKFHGSTNESVSENLATIVEAQAEQTRLYGEINVYEAEYKRRPWSRFHQLRSTDGARIHGTRFCSSLHRSDIGDLGWHPELSGKSEQEAVEALGPVMCSKCFKSAPVEWRRDPKDLKANLNACPGAEKSPVEGTRRFQPTWNGGYDEAECTGCGEMKRLRSTDWKIGKHDKPKSKVNEIMAPDGSPLKVGTDILKTVRTAEISYTGDAAYVVACKAGYSATGRLAEAFAHAELVLQALAAKNGTSVEAERERLAPKVAKKAKQYR